MKKNIMMIALAAALLPAMAMAADVTGTWVRDAKSDPMPDPMYWLVRGVINGNPNAEVVLTVKQDPATLTVTAVNRKLRNIPLDGKPRVGPTETGIQKQTVTGVNQPDAVLITTTQPFGGMPGNAELTMKESWTLSPDGKVLTITTVRQLPARTSTDRQIFNRR